MENATLIEKIEITPELMIIKVKPDVGIPEFTCGQYVALGLLIEGKLIKRAYSIGSSPAQKEFLEFYIAKVANGALTSRLCELKIGDRLYCAPKIAGTFTLQGVPDEANLILVATGTGLAPYISMIRSDNLWTPSRTVKILHGVRYKKDFAYQDEISSFIQTGKPLEYFPVVSRENPINGEFTKGYVQDLFINRAITLDPRLDHVFLCGNPAMVEDVEKFLVTLGYTVHSKKNPGSLHLEKYW